MSGDALKHFLAKIEAEPELQNELSKLLGKAPGGAMRVADFVALAVRHGFDVDETDLAGHVAGGMEGEELESVVGGVTSLNTKLTNASTGFLQGIRLINASTDLLNP